MSRVPSFDMDTRIGIGISTKLDSFIAGKEAAKIAYTWLGNHSPNIVIIFISPIFNQREAIKGIRSITDKTFLIGCSSAGSITVFGSFRNSVTVCAISSATINFSYGIGNNVSKNPRLVGREAAKQASSRKDIARQAYIMFSDYLSGNTADLLRGTQETLGTSFPIIGGSGTDDFQFQRTYQYINDNIYTDSTVGVLLGGNIKINVGKAHGWQPIGKPHRITKARSNIVKEIDRRRAIELYEEYLGKSFDELKIEGIAKLGSTYPLGMRVKENKEYLTRTPLKTEDSGSLIFSAEIPEREDINLMIGDKNLALEATKAACTKALRDSDKTKIKFAIVFSDIGRLQLLRKDAQSEVEIIKDALGKNVPFFGCYTCGEYAPIDMQEYKGQSYCHNQTISVAVFS